ncbi:succinate-semialdehyde dehydrogenase [Klebsiella pneumoniae]|uniref:Succinate-semialdehyde dehydrogenase n=1 Tax=Klebsiella pneumoniae TaxID=573 RepID=A0A2X3H022_KLEPN|nr:succinate-semialdehyde dehydrogenase [Klebsiella pneumoniae]
MVIKPANETPFTALAMAELANQAGIPQGVINVVTGQSREIGAVFTGDERVRKLSFTGSTEVGRVLMRQCAESIKKLSLELGGNAPFIVFDDADIDKAVEGALIASSATPGKPASASTASIFIAPSTTNSAISSSLASPP